MSKPYRKLLLSVGIAGLLAVGALWLGHSRKDSPLARYKAQLRAQGEKLSYADLGYPRPPLTNDTLPQLLAAAERLKQLKFQPGSLLLMDLSAPGRAKLGWTRAKPQFGANTPGAVAAMDRPEFTAIFHQAEPELTDMRKGLLDPPRYWILAPSSAFSAPLNPFVLKRTMARWLSADVVAALHERQLTRAQANLHALAKLVELHRDEPTLVNQMIRIAIADLALAATWEALGAQGWTEPSLAALQSDWEQPDLLETIETGISGDRVLGEEAMAELHLADSSRRRSLLGGSPSDPRTIGEYVNHLQLVLFWRFNADADELFYLQHYQKCLEEIRELSSGTPWPTVRRGLANQFSQVKQATSGRLGLMKHALSAVAIPNTQMATQKTVHAEVRRRLTVTVLALERYKLEAGGYPSSLQALIPRFLSAMPMDLMSAKPLCYHLDTDGTFTLHSVGEDGRDDGGDATSGSVTNKFEFWSGRDAVWPVAAGKD